MKKEIFKNIKNVSTLSQQNSQKICKRNLQN